MISLMVENADPWWRHIETLGFRDKYPASCSDRPRCSRGGGGYCTSVIPAVCSGTSLTGARKRRVGSVHRPRRVESIFDHWKDEAPDSAARTRLNQCMVKTRTLMSVWRAPFPNR